MGDVVPGYHFEVTRHHGATPTSGFGGGGRIGSFFCAVGEREREGGESRRVEGMEGVDRVC